MTDPPSRGARLDLRSPWVRTLLLLVALAIVAGVSSLIERDRAALGPVDTVLTDDGGLALERLVGLDAPEAAALLEDAGFEVDTVPLRLSDLGGLREGMVTDVSVEHNQPLEAGARLILTVVEQAEP